MKKGSFDLTGKAIDCRQLPGMGDAGKEIFRALKVACSEGEYAYGFLEVSTHPFMRYAHNLKQRKVSGFTSRGLDQLILPIDVLGQARIDAAKDGSALVFEGDVVPRHSNVIFYADGTKMHGCDSDEYIVRPGYPIIAYKPREEKQPSIQSRVLSEKMGFKELCPVCSPKDWADREAETYDELRDAHLDLVRENMLLVKENEALAQRIKNLHRAINDARACLDE